MKVINFLLLALVTIALVACGDDKSSGVTTTSEVTQVNKSTPDGALKIVIASVRNNDLKTLIENSMSKEEYNELVTEFETNKGGFSESDNLQFQQMMGMLQSEGAVDSLYAMAEPQLEQARAMLPMMVMMGKDQAIMSIDSNPMVPEEQKESAKKVASAVIDWIGENDILSEEITRNAISAAVNMANDLNMSSLDELKTMSFDQALEKGSIVLNGTKKVLEAYGISVDEMLDSIAFNDVQVNGDSATMNMQMTLFGEEISQQVKMIQKDGKWISEQ